MSRMHRLSPEMNLLAVVTSSIILSTSLAGEIGPVDQFRGWVLSYCDGEEADDAIQFEYGTCSQEDAYYHLAAPGVRWKTLRQGSGQAATQGDLVVVEYIGWLLNEEAEYRRGAVIGTSYTIDHRSFEFSLGADRVIAGWDKGVRDMKLGEVRELIISPDMAYGNRGAGNLIPPDSRLIFEIELLDLRGED